MPDLAWLALLDAPRPGAVPVTDIDGVQAGRPRIRVTAHAKLVDIIVRLAPRRYPNLTVLLDRRFRSSS